MNWVQEILSKHTIDFANETLLREIVCEFVHYFVSNPEFENSQNEIDTFREFILGNPDFLSSSFWCYNAEPVLELIWLDRTWKRNEENRQHAHKITVFYHASFADKLVDYVLRLDEQRKLDEKDKELDMMVKEQKETAAQVYSQKYGSQSKETLN